MSLDEAIAKAVRDAVRAELPSAVRAALRDAMSGQTGNGCEYLTTAQAASIALVDDETIRDWIRDGRLPAHRAGRLLRVRRDELAAFLDGKRSGTAPSGESAETWADAVLGRQKAGG